MWGNFVFLYYIGLWFELTFNYIPENSISSFLSMSESESISLASYWVLNMRENDQCYIRNISWPHKGHTPSNTHGCHRLDCREYRWDIQRQTRNASKIICRREKKKRIQNIFIASLTLSQWSSSGNPVAIQCAWNLDPSVYWNATREMPVCFQWSSSGFPVVFQCVPIMQINTGSPLGHHWVQASASVYPVAFQCTCGSSGLPVCSNYAN